MGFAPIKKYETFEFKEVGADDEEQPVSIRIRRSLSGDELRVLTKDVTIRSTASELYERIAEHIDGWNQKAVNTDTGKIEAVPVPTLEKYDQLGLLPDSIVFALFARLRSGPERRVEEQAKN